MANNSSVPGTEERAPPKLRRPNLTRKVLEGIWAALEIHNELFRAGREPEGEELEKYIAATNWLNSMNKFRAAKGKK